MVVHVVFLYFTSDVLECQQMCADYCVVFEALVTVHSYRKIPAYERAGYGPHWDPLSLREARSGTNAVKYTAISTGGLQGIPMRTIPCPLIRCFIGSREQ